VSPTTLRLVAFVAFVTGVAVTLLWQHVAAHMRYRRMAKLRAAAYLRFRQELVPKRMPTPGERTYPGLPIVDGAETSQVIALTKVTKVSRGA